MSVNETVQKYLVEKMPTFIHVSMKERIRNIGDSTITLTKYSQDNNFKGRIVKSKSVHDLIVSIMRNLDGKNGGRYGGSLADHGNGRYILTVNDNLHYELQTK